MFRALRNWFNRNTAGKLQRARPIAWIPKSAFPSSPRSNPFPYDLGTAFESRCDGPVPASVDPRVLFPLLRRLRDFIPDVSAGVWAWVRLCSTAMSYSLDGGSEAERDRAKAILDNLDRRIYGSKSERQRGVEKLMQNFFLSVFTYGAFCGEVILDDRRRRIERFVIVDPATIRFKLQPGSREWRPYQILADNSLTALHPASFFYFGLDTDGLSPYGRSPLLALPLVIRLQQQMIHDMARAQHNAGYPAIHFKISTPQHESRQSWSDYNERMQEQLNQVRAELREREADSNLVTLDNVEVRYLGPNGIMHQWSESVQAIGEQVVSALHLAPFMIGRNWGTTESWGTAQYHLLTNNARTVQEGAKRLADWLRNLELILNGLPLRAEHQFAPHHHVDGGERAKAFQISARTLMELSEKGMLEPEAAKQRIEALLRFL